MLNFVLKLAKKVFVSSLNVPHCFEDPVFELDSPSGKPLFPCLYFICSNVSYVMHEESCCSDFFFSLQDISTFSIKENTKQSFS